jgi:NitT/TauT family transport system substrate-binding protein
MTGTAPTGRRRGRLVLATLAALACAMTLTFTACGGDDNGGGSSGGGGGGDSASTKPVTLTVGVIPIGDVAPLYVGMEQGFFKQENLTIEPKLAEGGAAIVPSVLSGDDQIGFSNVTSLVIASSKNLPVQIISSGVKAGKGADDAFDAMFVKKNSPIKGPKDLEGKTVSVNNLNNVGPLTINNAMEKAGADPKKVKYLEVPFPDAIAALKAGRVDAAWVVEPFRSQGVAAGFRMIMHPFEETAPNYEVATYFASKEYIAKNPDVVQRFVRAMDKSLDYAQQHPEAVLKAVPTYTKIPSKPVENMVLPTWGPEINEPSVQLTIDLSAKYGFIENKPSMDDLIHRGGAG